MIIYKHFLDKTLNTVPKGTVLKVGFQNGFVCAWIQQDPDEAKTQTLVLVPTGEAIPFLASMEYIDSAVSDRLVFHVYKKCM